MGRSRSRSARGLAALGVTLAFGAAFAAASNGARAGEPSAPLQRAQSALLDRLPQVKRFVGEDVTNDIIVRLGEDLEYRNASPPANYPAASWNETLSNIERLDADLVAQILAGRPRPVTEIRGLGETFVRMRADDTYQPVAIYVPSGYDATKASPLAIVLHGRPQTEVELLSPPVLRRLADATGTILVAPWGRGNYDFAEPAGSEVYEVLDAALAAFNVDPKRLYLTGYSMGGFSVFKVGPLHSDRWAGVMSISGAIVNSQTATVAQAFKNTKLYVVNGGDDESIPAQFGAQTATFLSRSGIATGFYQEQHGTHALRTLERVLNEAWRDMLAGKPRGAIPSPIQNAPKSAPLPVTGRGMPT